MAETTDPVVVIRALNGVAEQVVRKLALDIVAELVKAPSEGGTPIDTSWASNNWTAQITSPRREPIGSPENAGAAAAEQQASLGALLGYRLLNGPVFITNNVPYITLLNQGTSKQAPAGFVQAAITRAVEDLRSVG